MCIHCSVRISRICLTNLYNLLCLMRTISFVACTTSILKACIFVSPYFSCSFYHLQTNETTVSLLSSFVQNNVQQSLSIWLSLQRFLPTFFATLRSMMLRFGKPEESRVKIVLSRSHKSLNNVGDGLPPFSSTCTEICLFIDLSVFLTVPEKKMTKKVVGKSYIIWQV